MKTTTLSSLDQNLIEFDAQLDAMLEQGHNFESDEDKDKGSGVKKAAGAAAIGAGAGAGALYARGRSVSGGNAKGSDAFRIGARDVGNKMAGAKNAVKGAVKSAGTKTGGFLSKAGKAITKVAKKFDTLEAMTNLSAELDTILNFEVIDDATAKKPKNPTFKAPDGRKPDHRVAAIAAVGAGTVGAAAGYAGTKHSAQIVKAGKRGMTMAKEGYKTGKSKMAKAGKGIMAEGSNLLTKLRKK
jgi:hypothetical protein